MKGLEVVRENNQKGAQEGNSEGLKDFVYERKIYIITNICQIHTIFPIILIIKSNYITTQLTNIFKSKLFPNKTSLVSVG